MAARAEVAAVYGAGLIQGVALVTFPAASSILTSPSYYGLTNTAYGSLFLPQALAAIAASLFGARLTKRAGAKRILLAGLVGDVAAMALLVVSQFTIGAGPLPYLVLLLATTSLGIGFGLTVPSLNNLVGAFFRSAVDRAVLYLNALLGLGTALAPVLVAVFLGIGWWWGLPLIVAILTPCCSWCASGCRCTSRRARRGRTPDRHEAAAGIPPVRRVRAAVRHRRDHQRQLVEPVPDRLDRHVHRDRVARADHVLGDGDDRAGPVRGDRAAIPGDLDVPVAAVHRGDRAGLPPPCSPPAMAAGVLVFALAGLGCSALLPLTISFGQHDLPEVGAAAAGLLIAFYQMGYGIAAFGFGPIQDLLGVGLAAMFGLAAVVALGMGSLSFVIVRARHASDTVAVAAQPARQ